MIGDAFHRRARPVDLVVILQDRRKATGSECIEPRPAVWIPCPWSSVVPHPLCRSHGCRPYPRAHTFLSPRLPSPEHQALVAGKASYIAAYSDTAPTHLTVPRLLSPVHSAIPRSRLPPCQPLSAASDPRNPVPFEAACPNPR